MTPDEFQRWCEAKRREHAAKGDDFDPSELAPQFIPYFELDRVRRRIRVSTYYGDGKPVERTGTVGITTGWRPAFLLMHRSSDHGSSDLLGERDHVVAVQSSRRGGYVPVG